MPYRSPDWTHTIATFEARQLLLARLTQVEAEGHRHLVSALAFLGVKQS